MPEQRLQRCRAAYDPPVPSEVESLVIELPAWIERCRLFTDAIQDMHAERVPERFDPDDGLWGV